MQFEIEKVRRAADTLRYLTLMAVEKPASGHPGLPLGCAELGVLLYRYFLKGSGKTPTWANRDRFVLSAGHGSMFLYGLGHLFDYGFSIKDLASFRAIGSKTPGHPEYDPHLGIETTTGPLGAGFANAVGIALEQKILADRFNRPGFELFNARVVTLMGDGCTQEGVTNEAASMAGHLGLDNLTAVYDSNNISIDGHVDLAMTEDVGGRYRALGWHVENVDGSDHAAVASSLEKLLQEKAGKPKLLIMKTEIGTGLNKLKGSHKIHGAAAGLDEIAWFVENSTFTATWQARHPGVTGAEAVKAKLKEELASGEFTGVDAALRTFLDGKTTDGEAQIAAWNKLFAEYERQFPAEAALYRQFNADALPEGLRKQLLEYRCDAEATRKVSAAVLGLVTDALPQVIGGSADLVGSTFATVKGSTYVQKGDYKGRNIPFGIREHGMGSLGNGLALGQKLIPFTSTFFTFFDYMKPAVRLASLMKIKHLFIFTHDSIYVGEDGPTHQPIEHLGALRLIPGLKTFRPANDMETGFAYLNFLENQGPAVVLGTRQVLAAPLFKIEGDRAAWYEKFKKGGYVLQDAAGKPDVVLAGSGSEVSTLVEAKALLEAKGLKVRLVSVPCLEFFEAAGPAWWNEVLGENLPVYYAEAASHRGNRVFYDRKFTVKTMDRFGESGNFKSVAKHFGFTADAVAEAAAALVK